MISHIRNNCLKTISIISGTAATITGAATTVTATMASIHAPYYFSQPSLWSSFTTLGKHTDAEEKFPLLAIITAVGLFTTYSLQRLARATWNASHS